MKYRSLALPHSRPVDVFLVPCARDLHAPLLEAFAGPDAKLEYRAGMNGREAVLDLGPGAKVSHVSCAIGDWLVRDAFGNFSKWDDRFFHQFFEAAA